MLVAKLIRSHSAHQTSTKDRFTGAEYAEDGNVTLASHKMTAEPLKKSQQRKRGKERKKKDRDLKKKLRELESKLKRKPEDKLKKRKEKE